MKAKTARRVSIMPFYFVECDGPEHDCHNYVCRWVEPVEKAQEPFEASMNYAVILECHEDDALKLCRLLNKFDPWGEKF
jgi:hypothetical protein